MLNVAAIHIKLHRCPTGVRSGLVRAAPGHSRKCPSGVVITTVIIVRMTTIMILIDSLLVPGASRRLSRLRTPQREVWTWPHEEAHDTRCDSVKLVSSSLSSPRLMNHFLDLINW